nr:hypothetical protein [uncultured Sphingomonas sp.]
MSNPADTSGASSEAPGVSTADQASIEVGQRGLSEPTNDFTPAPAGPQRPEYIPEKFWKDGKADLEGLAKSYAELERARSNPQTPAEAPAAEAPAAEVKPDGKIEKTQAEAEAAAAAEAAANPNGALATAMETARTEWADKQEVSEENIAALEAAGIPREVFNLYIEGVKAQQAAAYTAIHSYVDGEENYKLMAGWAGQNLSDAELDAFNAALDNPEGRENAVRGLYARYTAARPSEGTMITPAGTPSAAGDTYTDRDQMIRDQRDPRYATDPAFRQGVMEKLQRSQRNGFSVVPRSLFEKQVLSN